MEQVFARIREAGLKVKPDKCFFLSEQVRYLGHIVSKNGIEADTEKTTKVKPRNVKEVQQFLGFANYYRRFIKNFAEIAKPLHKLTERSAAPFRWTCHEYFGPRLILVRPDQNRQPEMGGLKLIARFHFLVPSSIL